MNPQVWFEAAERGDLDTLRKLAPTHTRTRDERGLTALMVATLCGQARVLPFLAEAESGLFINGWSALSLAARDNNVLACRQLVSFELSLSGYADEGYPLHAAAIAGSAETFDLLLYKRTDLDSLPVLKILAARRSDPKVTLRMLRMLCSESPYLFVADLCRARVLAVLPEVVNFIDAEITLREGGDSGSIKQYSPLKEHTGSLRSRSPSPDINMRSVDRRTGALEHRQNPTTAPPVTAAPTRGDPFPEPAQEAPPASNVLNASIEPYSEIPVQNPQPFSAPDYTPAYSEQYFGAEAWQRGRCSAPSYPVDSSIQRLAEPEHFSEIETAVDISRSGVLPTTALPTVPAPPANAYEEESGYPMGGNDEYGYNQAINGFPGYVPETEGRPETGADDLVERRTETSTGTENGPEVYHAEIRYDDVEQDRNSVTPSLQAYSGQAAGPGDNPESPLVNRINSLDRTCTDPVDFSPEGFDHLKRQINEFSGNMMSIMRDLVAGQEMQRALLERQNSQLSDILTRSPSPLRGPSFGAGYPAPRPIPGQKGGEVGPIYETSPTPQYTPETSRGNSSRYY
ncbi:Ankyrin repeat protein 1 [Giardia muris]|uniref:Ankyrin repeat protein 1 n=1 Tax=Giardia muris TaxID=5742 RepID=A0A4Z1SMI9_GIAMU|nr:Ankyrin repeat protein 1 [Giardia muris]|eukprot:TNJ26906.1 Ankyrin repeat protein 1 [Giardia muris]